jgi:hypothetical protein
MVVYEANAKLFFKSDFVSKDCVSTTNPVGNQIIFETSTIAKVKKMAGEIS